MRRWLVILGVIATVAVAVAIYAAIQASESEEEKADRARVVVLERQLRDVEGRLGKASEESDVRRLQRSGAEESDVAKLDRRLRRVEDDMTDVADSSADTGRAVNRLDQRLDVLSRRIQALRRR